MKFSVPNMSCGHCIAAIEKALKASTASADVACDLETRTVEVTGFDSAQTAKAAMQAAGYDAELVQGA